MTKGRKLGIVLLLLTLAGFGACYAKCKLSASVDLRISLPAASYHVGDHVPLAEAVTDRLPLRIEWTPVIWESDQRGSYRVIVKHEDATTASFTPSLQHRIDVFEGRSMDVLRYSASTDIFSGSEDYGDSLEGIYVLDQPGTYTVQMVAQPVSIFPFGWITRRPVQSNIVKFAIVP